MNVVSCVKTKSSATPMMISGITNDTSIWKLNTAGRRPRQRSTPIANTTPIGTAITVVITASLRVWKSASRSVGSFHTEPAGSRKYQRSEKPCHAVRLRPALNEKSTASATGRIDQRRYSHVIVSSMTGRRHGFEREGRNRYSGDRRSPALRNRKAAALDADLAHASTIERRDVLLA